MQISTEVNGEFLEMRVAGRLDNEWSAHLSKALDEAIRQGSHSVVMDLNEVEYLSSAGIGALVRAYKQFQAIHGFFGVATAAPQVSEVIRLTGLAKMLLCDPDKIRRPADRFQSTVMPEFRFAALGGMLFEVYDIAPQAKLTVQVIGNPDRLPRASYGSEQCQRQEFPKNSFGLGQGAFGGDFSDCANRFGEFLAVGGSAAQLPTNGTGKPDYQLGTGDFVPSVQMLYGLRCAGQFAIQHRFEPHDPKERISFSKLVEQSLNLSKSDAAGMVFLAETAGLVGASLRRSPAMNEDGSAEKFSHPEIRRWLNFSPERVFPHSLALIVGVAARGEQAQDARLAPLLRPLGPQSAISAHFHAAVFSYRPFKKRKLNLDETVTTLFESEDLQGVLHLLHDDRPIIGCGESEFVRGGCWISPITTVQQEGV
ncbi:MAG: STAS domain-containing protein [Planctomycetota bacterium]